MSLFKMAGSQLVPQKLKRGNQDIIALNQYRRAVTSNWLSLSHKSKLGGILGSHSSRETRCEIRKSFFSN